MDSEATALIELVRTLLIVAATFGFALNDSQQAAIIGAIGAAAVVISGLLAWFNRSKVFAPATVQKIADAATQLPAGTPVDIGNPPAGTP